MQKLCGMAVNRLGITPTEFYWEFTPVELNWAFEDYNNTQFTPMKRICEAVRIVSVTVHNSAMGRKPSELIRDPKKIIQFGWERARIQTLEEMRSVVLGLSHMKGVKVSQKGKPVKGV